jgi:hypothetical protein
MEARMPRQEIDPEPSAVKGAVIQCERGEVIREESASCQLARGHGIVDPLAREWLYDSRGVAD